MKIQWNIKNIALVGIAVIGVTMLVAGIPLSMRRIQAERQPKAYEITPNGPYGLACRNISMIEFKENMGSFGLILREVDITEEFVVVMDQTVSAWGRDVRCFQLAVDPFRHCPGGESIFVVSNRGRIATWLGLCPLEYEPTRK